MTTVMKFFPVLAIVLAGFVSTSGLTPVAFADDEVFRIAGRPYTAKELCGSSRSELRKQFEDEIRNLSDDRLREMLGGRGSLQRLLELKGKLKDRSTLKEVLWKSALGNMLDYAVRHLILAHITDSIAKDMVRNNFPESWFLLPPPLWGGRKSLTPHPNPPPQGGREKREVIQHHILSSTGLTWPIIMTPARYGMP